MYFIGDSIQVTQVPPGNSQCPSSLTVPLGTGSLTADSATVIVRHKRISDTKPDPPISSFTIDSITRGQVWGHLSMTLYQVVPEFGGPSATLTGSFRLSEIEYLGVLPHCTTGAA